MELEFLFFLLGIKLLIINLNLLLMIALIGLASCFGNSVALGFLDAYTFWQIKCYALHDISSFSWLIHFTYNINN